MREHTLHTVNAEGNTMKTAIVISAVIVLTGCASTGKNVIRTANTAHMIESLSRAGVEERVANCMRDWFDTADRGSSCAR